MWNIFFVCILTYGFSLYGSYDDNSDYAIGFCFETVFSDLTDDLKLHRKIMEKKAMHNISQKLNLVKNVSEKTASSCTSNDTYLRNSKSSIAKFEYIKENKAQLEQKFRKKSSLFSWMRCYSLESKVFNSSKK